MFSDGKPLLTKFDSERAESCASMEASGVGLESTPGLVTRASGEPPIGYEHNTYALKKPKMRHVTTRMANSVRGALYDLQHFDELPPAQSGESPSAVTKFALTRDNRTPYLLLVLILILVICAMCSLARSGTSKK
jgi:hypothetical protein